MRIFEKQDRPSLSFPTSAPILSPLRFHDSKNHHIQWIQALEQAILLQASHQKEA